MDDDMDVDLVIDEDDEIARMKAEAQQELERATAAESAMTGIEAAEEGEINANDAVPYKVHIRGLDTLTTNDIKAFLTEHHNSDSFKRVEWIDDTSANLIFDNEQAASEALAALSQDEQSQSTTLRSAKQVGTHPNIQLEIRQAIAADVKLPGAKDRSRFYLMNPEWDPDMRAAKKRRFGEDGDRSYKKHRGDGRGRRGSAEPEQYSVDMYDDNTGVKEQEARRQKRTQFEDLFKNRKAPATLKKRDEDRNGRLRDRSASPISDGEGKYGFEETQPARKTARMRSSTPPHLRVARPRDYGDADRKYAKRRYRHGLMEEVNRGRELFPDKNHKRSDAQDLKRDNVADIIGDERPSKGDLFSRVSYPGERRPLEGFSIMGAAKERGENPLVKELFPMKASNAGKELFDGKIKGRAARRRAEDLF